MSKKVIKTKAELKDRIETIQGDIETAMSFTRADIDAAIMKQQGNLSEDVFQERGDIIEKTLIAEVAEPGFTEKKLAKLMEVFSKMTGDQAIPRSSEEILPIIIQMTATALACSLLDKRRDALQETLQAVSIELEVLTKVQEKLARSEKKVKELEEKLAKKEAPLMIRQSEYLHSHFLRSSKPGEQDLTEYLTDRIISKIAEHNRQEGNADIQIATDLKGVNNLSRGDWKIFDALGLMVANLSENTDRENDPDFYRGNGPQESEKRGDFTVTNATLDFTQYQWAKALSGGNDLDGGNDIPQSFEALRQFSRRKFLIVHTEKIKYKNTKGQDVTGEFSTIELVPLIEIIDTIAKIKTGSGPVKEIKSVAIRLHFLFNRKIDSWYLKAPGNLIALTEQAYGAAVVPQAVYELREYLRQLHKHPKNNRKMDVDTLHKWLYPNLVAQRKKKLIAEKIEENKAAQVNLGLLISMEIVKGKRDQPQYFFRINKEWCG